MAEKVSTKQAEQTEEFDVFIANSVYPNARLLFDIGPNSIEEIKDDSIIVPDTNVLLFPFNTSKESLVQIENTLRELVNRKQLIIPGQVAREFVNNRATKLAELFQQLNRKISSIPQLQKGRYPLLESIGDYQKAIAIEKEIDERIKVYKNTLKKVKEHVINWIWNDPVSLMYNKLFKDETIFDPEINKEEILQELNRRRIHHLPPGYKDKTKDDSGIGDFLIWHTILEIGKLHKKNVILVSGEEKADWWYRSENQVMFPRYELVDEFRRNSEGKLFHIIPFSTFLDLYGASKDVVKEVREKEMQKQSDNDKVRVAVMNLKEELEVKIYKIAILNKIPVRRKHSLGDIMQLLVQREILSSTFASRLHEINILGIKASNDELLENEADRVIEQGAELIATLDEIIQRRTAVTRF